MSPVATDFIRKHPREARPKRLLPSDPYSGCSLVPEADARLAVGTGAWNGEIEEV